LDFKEKIKNTKREGGYDPGDHLVVSVKDIHGIERKVEFEIENYCGGGFAGQVYGGRCVSSEDNWLAAGKKFAVKIFITRSKSKSTFRDALYFLGFQSPFPYQYNEDAARTGLYLTRIFKIVCKEKFGTDEPINDCYGTFWDQKIGAYAEINEWVEGYVTEPEMDEDIFIRMKQNSRIKKDIKAGKATEQDLLMPHDEMSRKRRFMEQWVRLCNELGLEDIARQVYWWTGVSQPNVLTKKGADGKLPFIWVDRRPGLPGFVLSAGDCILFPKAVFRGSIPPFDRINFKKLRAWPAIPDKKEWNELVDKLEETDRKYRRTQLDLFGHNIRLLLDSNLRQSINMGRIDFWRLSGRIDEKNAGRLRTSYILFFVQLILSLIPLIGRRLQQLTGNSDFRIHLWKIFTEHTYRYDYFDKKRCQSLKLWIEEGRITWKRAEICGKSFLSYFKDMTYTWLPPGWQYILTDQECQFEFFRKLFTSPLKYIFIKDYRRQVNVDWITSRTEEDVKHGYVTREVADNFINIAGEEALQNYITGLIVTAAVKPTSEIIYVLLGVHLAFNTTTLSGLGWWGLLAAPVVALISPAGLLRFFYCIMAKIWNRKIPYGVALALSPIRGIGDFAFLIQTGKTFPSFSSYLIISSLCQLVEQVPVFGERGGLLSLWTVTAFISWPASLHKLWHCKNKDYKLINNNI